MGLKEEIAEKVNKVLGSIVVPDLDATVYIREISVGDRILMTSDKSKFPTDMRPTPVTDDDGNEVKDDKGKTVYEDMDQYGGPKLVLVGAADSEGKRIWGNDDFDDVLALSQDAMLAIAKEVAKLNKLDDDSGNSPQSRTDASPSDSAKK